MGSVFGKIDVETPKFQLIQSTPDYEIRQYPSSVVAQVTYDPTSLGGKTDAGFTILANYIGALGQPHNTKPQETIPMTAPVITQTSEKIAMTAPVITQTTTEEEQKKKMVTMQFVLPSKYAKAEEAPRPTDERVVIKQVDETKYGVVKFSGVTTDALVVQAKVDKLKTCLERDGFKVIGDFLLARYNPPWTLPPFRTNEIMIPIQ